MNWQVLTLISVLFFSISGLLQKVLQKDDTNNPIAFTVIFQLGVALLVGLFGLIYSDMTFPNLLPLSFNLLLMTILYAFGNIFLFKAIKEIDVSIVSIIFSLRVLFTTAASALLLNQGLSLIQIIGTFLILSGVILVNWEGKSIKISKGDFYAFLAAVFFGFALTNDKYLIDSFDIYPYVFLAFLLPPIGIIITIPRIISHMKFFLDRSNLMKLIILCAVYATASICLYTALQLTPNSSQLSAISLTTVAVTVILSIFFLGERKRIFQKFLGSALCLSGLLLVS